MMTDERLFALFEGYGRPAEPSPEFLDRLELDLRRRVGHAHRPLGWRLQALTEAVSPRLAPKLRVAWAVTLVALVLAVISIAALVGARLTGLLSTANEVVLSSQAVYADPPPFEMEVRPENGGRVQYAFDGDARFRMDLVEGTDEALLPGGYMVRDAGRQAWYGSAEAGANTWFVTDFGGSFLIDAYPLIGMEPGWIGRVPIESSGPLPWPSCSDGWRFGEADVVAGRPADQVTCGTDAWWIDRESRFVVRHDAGGRVVAEALRLTLSPSFSAERFLLDPPQGAEIAGEEDSDDPPPLRPESDALRIGQPAPPWKGTFIDGGTFSTEELTGKPAALFIWCACASGPQVQAFAAEARSRAESMKLVLVSLDQEGTIRGLVDWLGIETPVVHDQAAEGSLLETWGLSSFPALVLFRADGTVADIHPGSFSETKLTAVLDALAAGETIPEPDARPAPIVDEQGRQPLSSVLEVGQPAPELRAPRLGGGELSTRDLFGRPTVVLHWSPHDAGDRPPDDAPGADRLLAAAARHAGELNVLLVAHGEPTQGAVARYLGEQGTDVPVIFDWDGTLHQRWGLLIWPTLVLLDADGRVAGYYGPDAVADPAALLDALQAGEPLPSPSPEWL